jgi:hypothetical protein
VADTDITVISSQLNRIERDVKEVNDKLDKLNGQVRSNCTEIAILKATTLRYDAIKIGTIIGGVLVVMAALLKVAGVF